MESDFDLGTMIRDDLIPLALEYYLGVIKGDSDEFEDEEGDVDDNSGEDESDDNKKSKKNK